MWLLLIWAARQGRATAAAGADGVQAVPVSVENIYTHSYIHIYMCKCKYMRINLEKITSAYFLRKEPFTLAAARTEKGRLLWDFSNILYRVIVNSFYKSKEGRKCTLKMNKSCLVSGFSLNFRSRHGTPWFILKHIFIYYTLWSRQDLLLDFEEMFACRAEVH